MASSIADAQDGLEAIIRARNILDSRGNKVPLCVGYPPKGPEPEHIWIAGDVANWAQQQVLSGDEQADRHETFTLKVRLVVSFKDSYKDARNRLLAIVSEIELALRTGFTLQNKVWRAQMAGGIIGEGTLPERGMFVGATLNVAVEADVGG